MATWTNTTKNSSSWTNASKNSTSFTNVLKSDPPENSQVLLIDDSFSLLIDDTYQMLAQGANTGTKWNNITKN